MCKQQPVESVDQFVTRLQQLSKQCDNQAVIAEEYRLELMRDALIAGISSTPSRLPLLENRNLAFVWSSTSSGVSLQKLGSISK